MDAIEPIDTHTAVERLVRTAPNLRVEFESLVKEWSPEEPPLTVMFAELGRGLCRHAPVASDAELIEICAAIEDLILRGEETVQNAVATGLLEAMLAESSTGSFDMSILAGFLGAESKAYCRAWDEFTGNKTEGL